MAKLSVPESPKTYTTTYGDLMGLDVFDPKVEVSANHATEMVNMIPDSMGLFPVKRKGWRIVHTFGSAIQCAYYDIYNDTTYIGTANGVGIESGGTWTGVGTGWNVKHIIPFNGKIYFVSPSEGIFTLEGGSKTSITPKAPLTKYNLDPNALGGETYYSVNMLTQQQQYQYIGDGTSDTFYFHATSGFISKLVKVEYFYDQSHWETVATNKYDVVHEKDNSDNLVYYNVRNASNTSTSSITNDVAVKFKSGSIPGDYRNLAGNNVRITVEELDTGVHSTSGGVSTYYGYYNRARKKLFDSTIYAMYGSVETDRLFFVTERNKIHYCESNDITYFPDDNYIVAGNYAPIVGLHRKDDYLVAVTGDSDSHVIYLIKSSTAVVSEQDVGGDGKLENSSYEEQFFSVHPAASVKGAVATKSFATLIDDPLYLGSQGVYSIASTWDNSRTMIQDKSTYINPKLLNESNLKYAVACIWKHFYCIFINTHMYLLDSNNEYRDGAGNRCYEGYYCTNIPATGVVMPAGNELYFAYNDSDNSQYHWCKFNHDIGTNDAYYDNATYNGSLVRQSGGTVVKCSWASKLDDDGMPQYFKNLSKKGCVVTVLGYTKSSVNVYFSKDGSEDWIQTAKMADVPTNTTGIDVYTLKKVKKYKRLRIRVTNDEPEAFGLNKITKTWTLGNYAK